MPRKEHSVSELASFRQPPLREVALTVQFESLDMLTSAHVGLFWQEVRESFPRIQESVALPATPIERKGSRPTNLRVELLKEPPLTRTQFVDAHDREFVQIQHDRFIRNWRKGDENDVYPRYEKHIRPRFESEFRRFIEFAHACELGEVKPVQCEIAYFNVIHPVPSVWESFRDMHGATSTYSLPPVTDLPLEHDGSHLRQVFAILDSTGQFAGRLYTEVAPAIVDDRQAIRFNLTARGHPRCSTVDAAMEFLDLGRRLIVKFFEYATTEGMHNSWKRE